jgi:hypothetical protein
MCFVFWVSKLKFNLFSSKKTFKKILEHDNSIYNPKTYSSYSKNSTNYQNIFFRFQYYFSSWFKVQNKDFLIEQGLYSFIDGSKPYPPTLYTIKNVSPPISESEWIYCVQQDQVVMSTLIASLFANVFSQVIDC